MTSFSEWLRQIGLGHYAPVFVENDIDFEVIRSLTDDDLRQLGLSLGHRRKLQQALVALESQGVAAPTTRTSFNVPTPAEPLQAPSGERRQLTVMFCDLVGSTALAEQLDPEELRDLMQAYRKVCGEVVARYEGHVAQYLGDGLMVYFGWPSAHEDDAERGVRSALEMVQSVKGVSGKHPLAVRIGVATGAVVVGEASPEDNAEAKLAVGETPNLAARLQAVAGPDEIVIAPATRRLMGNTFELTELGACILKGIAEPVHLFRVVGARATESRFEAAHGGIALTPLVGREEEIALLLHRWQQARDSEGQVALISGEPGIGKSRLTQALRERIAGERYVALRYQCSPYHLNSALYPIIEQFEFAAGFAREDTAEQKLDKLEAVLVGSQEQRTESAALIAALLSLPTERYPPLKLSAQKQKEKTLEAFAGQIEALARREPVLMVFEDAHWIDPTSQESLDVLVPRLQGLPILLVITYRTEYTPHWAEQAHVTTLGLSRLGRRQGAELVAKVTGGMALPAEVLEQIVAHTDGVPLFVEELTKSVLESGLLREAGDQYKLQAPLPALAIPTSLRDSLLARLDRLAPVKEIAQIGACIGREFSYELLACISTLRNEQLGEALRKLTEAGLVHRRGSPPDATYTFKHALVQDAAYDSLLKGKRAQLHAQIAQVLERDFPKRVADEPELLAHHYTQAGNLAAAIPLWKEAGELSLARRALQEAVGHFQKGLALIEQRPPSPERDEVELSIREPLHTAWVGLRSWAAPEVAANAAAILQRAKSQGNPRSLLVGMNAMCININTQGRISDALEWAQRLLGEANKGEDIDLQIGGHRNVMNCRLHLGHLLEAREHGNLALALCDPQRIERTQLGDVRTEIGVWSSQLTWILGYPDEAVQANEERDAHARRLGNALTLCFALTRGAYAFDYRCEPERLLARVNEADRLAREQSIPFIYQMLVPTTEGLARLRSGQLPEAISLLRRGIENWNKLGANVTIPYLKSALAEALALQGDLDAALRLIDECLEQIERPGWQERVDLAEVLRLKGWMLMRQGRGEEAEVQLRASIDCARQQQAKSWELRSSTTLAQLLAERGQRDTARELLAPIYNWFTEGFDTRDLKYAKALLDELT